MTSPFFLSGNGITKGGNTKGGNKDNYESKKPAKGNSTRNLPDANKEPLWAKFLVLFQNTFRHAMMLIVRLKVPDSYPKVGTLDRQTGLLFLVVCWFAHVCSCLLMFALDVKLSGKRHTGPIPLVLCFFFRKKKHTSGRFSALSGRKCLQVLQHADFRQLLAGEQVPVDSWGGMGWGGG